MNLELVEETLQGVVIAASFSVSHIFGNAQARTMIKAGNAFIEITTDILSGQQKSLGEVGTRLWRRQGVMTFTVYVPVNKGTRATKVVQQEILDAFEGRTFTGIVFGDSGHKVIGTINKWELESLRLNFYFNITGR